MRLFPAVLFWFLGTGYFLAPTSLASVMELGRLPVPCLQALQEAAGEDSQRISVWILGGDGKTVAVSAAFYRPPRVAKELKVDTLQRCIALVDAASLQLASQWESKLKSVIAAVETREGLMVLGRTRNELVLEGQQKRYHWLLPPGLNKEPLDGGAMAVLEASDFPAMPLELAGPSGDGSTMVSIYRFFAPESASSPGLGEKVRSLVPAQEFVQAWLEATDYEGQLKSMWDQVTATTRLKAFVLGVNVKKEIRKNVAFKKESLPSSVSRLALGPERLLFHTQQPWSVAVVDLKDGHFRILVPESLGELKPLLAHSSFFPTFATGAEGKGFWLLVNGNLAETKESYQKAHPDRPCEFEGKLKELNLELCYYHADVLMRAEEGERGELATTFWVLGDEEKAVRRGLLQITKDFVDFLEVDSEELVLKRLRF